MLLVALLRKLVCNFRHFMGLRHPVSSFRAGSIRYSATLRIDLRVCGVCVHVCMCVYVCEYACVYVRVNLEKR